MLGLYKVKGEGRAQDDRKMGKSEKHDSSKLEHEKLKSN